MKPGTEKTVTVNAPAGVSVSMTVATTDRWAGAPGTRVIMLGLSCGGTKASLVLAAGRLDAVRPDVNSNASEITKLEK
jgi:hypothetical protein